MTLAELHRMKTDLARVLGQVMSEIEARSALAPEPPEDPGLPRVHVAAMEALYRLGTANSVQVAAEAGHKHAPVAEALQALRLRGLVFPVGKDPQQRYRLAGPQRAAATATQEAAA